MKRLLPSSEFSRHVLTLMTGTTIAQAIPVAISPVLTRLYTPAEFGVFALFIATASVLTAAANARYELAIVLPEADDDALSIAALGLLISSAMSGVLLLAVITFNTAIAKALGSMDVAPWLYFLPVVVFFTGFFNVLNYYASRQKRFSDIASASVAKAVVMAAVQLSLGMLKFGTGGLVAGHVAASFAANLRLLRKTRIDRSLREVVDRVRMARNARRFKDFPLYSLPAVFANSLSNNAGSVLIARFFSTAVLGHYALVQRVLGMPAALVGTSIGQVFYQRAAEERRIHGTAIRAFTSTLKKLLVIAVPTFTLAFLLVEDVFAFVFGEPWREAGRYAKILVPLFAVRFVVSPLSVINQVNLNNRFGLGGNLALLALTVCAIGGGGLLGLSIENVLVLWSISASVFYLGFLSLIYRQTRGE